MERRRDQRTRKRVFCEFAVEGQAHRGVVVDMSPRGLFVHTDAAIAPGTELEIQLAENPSFPELELLTVVTRRRVVPGLLSSVIRSGLGLRILDAPDAYYAALEGTSPAKPDACEDAHEEIDVCLADLDTIAEEVAESSAAEPAPGVEQEEPDEQDERPERRVPFADGGSGESWVSPASEAPSLALVIDDGELDDVQAMLTELGANPVRHRLRDPSGFRGWEEPPRLFVAAARSALSIHVPSRAAEQRVITIAIGEHDSQTLCALMRRQGFQYVVRRPVHPEALRLLFLRALHRKSDQRREPRFPFGYEVTWWLNWRRWRGPLLEISPSGCRLLGPPHDVDPGTRISVRIPKEAADGRALTLRGRVVRSEFYRVETRKRHVSLAVTFEDLRPKTRERLGVLLAARSIGPATLPRDPKGGRRRARDATPKAQRERRRDPRGAFRQEVVSLDDRSERVMHVLIGRDLSVGGIRVEAHPVLAAEDEVRLAIYDASRPAPLIVDARVIRDDGQLGLSMKFLDVEPPVAFQLEKIVSTLPAVEALHSPGRGSASEPLVVTDILEKREVD